MLSRAIIHSAHRALQNLFPKNQVLVGGSYVYDEATEDSDVDFYVLLKFWDFFHYKNYKELLVQFKRAHPYANIMLVPCRRNGRPWKLYYISAHDVDGRIVVWSDHRVLVRSAYKLALFNFIRYKAVQNNKIRNLQKSIKQLATAVLVQNGSDYSENLFTWKYITDRHQVFSENFNKTLHRIQKISQASTEEEVERCGRELEIILRQYVVSFKDVLRFSWYHYCIYNLFFMYRKRWPILLADPEVALVRQMLSGLESKLPAVDLYNSMRKIVFPVLII